MLEVPEWSLKAKTKVVENMTISRNYRQYKKNMKKLFSYS